LGQRPFPKWDTLQYQRGGHFRLRVDAQGVLFVFQAGVEHFAAPNGRIAVRLEVEVHDRPHAPRLPPPDAAISLFLRSAADPILLRFGAGAETAVTPIVTFSSPLCTSCPTRAALMSLLVTLVGAAVDVFASPTTSVLFAATLGFICAAIGLILFICLFLYLIL
jgi:hypothetical protein